MSAPGAIRHGPGAGRTGHITGGGPLGGLDRWFLAVAPAERLAVLRVLVGGFATAWSLVRLPAHLGLADHAPHRWAPVGVLAPLGAPPPSWAVTALAVAVPALGLAATLGWRYRLVAPVWALGLLVLTTMASSWGQIFHTENLLVLHALVLAAAPAADAVSLDARRRGAEPPGPSGRYGWPVRVAAMVTVVAYVLAGVAKLRASGLDWAGGDVLRNLVAHDNLRKAVLGDAHSPLGAAAVRHGWLFPPMAAVSLLVELAAPIALLGGRLRTLWVGAAWVFHLGVLALMAILFPYQLVPVAFAPLFAVERLLPWWRRRLAGLRAPPMLTSPLRRNRGTMMSRS